MKLVIAGSRDVRDYQVVKNAIEWSDYDIPDEVVSGKSQGVDQLGERFAREMGVDISRFEADWDGKGKAAGPIRNREMAEYGEALLAIWDGQSAGTRSMIEKAYEEGIPVQIYLTEDPPENDLTKDELLRRLPEIDTMKQSFYRSFLIDAFLNGCPEYFWELPTSSTGKYHPEDEGGKHGNWIHTRRVFSTYQDSSESLVEAGVITEWDREAGLAAALLHDMLKYGYPEREGKHTIKYHDVLGAAYIRQHTELPDKVARLVNIHNGPWHVGPTPETQHEWLFHQCDMIAARRQNNMGINGPVVDELTDVSDMIVEK